MADPPRLRVGGRLPSIESLAEMTDAELSLLLRRFGLPVDRGQRLEDAVIYATGQLRRAGAPSQAVIARVLGQAERMVSRELMHETRETLRQHARAQMADSDLEVWIAVDDGHSPQSCNDCIALHGTVKPAAVWDAEGGPGSDNTVCDGNCRCDLKPAAGYEGAEAGDIQVEITLEAV